MWLSDLKLVLPDRVLACGSIHIEAGRIAEIVEGPAPQRNGNSNGPVRSLHGLTAIPGIIDMHGDMLEREIEPRPKAYLPYDLALHELDKRLAASGVTTAYAAISFSEISIVRNSLRREEAARAIVQAIHDERDELLVDIRVHARFEVTNPNAPPMLLSLVKDDLVDLVSLNDHTPGQGQYRDVEAYVAMIADWRKISADYAHEVTRERINQIRSVPIAWDVIQQVTELARAKGLPIASHDDDTAEKVALMESLGGNISEFPVTLEAAQEARRRHMHVAMGAPNALRGVSTSGNLSARDAIAAGVVDLLAADYHPGALLQAAYLLTHDGILPLHESIKLITANVADAVRKPDIGVLTVGKRADIVLIEGDLADGRRPRVRATFRNGQPIFLDKRVAGVI